MSLCVDARQYREGDAALDRVLELFKLRMEHPTMKNLRVFLPEHNTDLPLIFQNIENDHDLPNLELKGTVGSHRVLDGSNDAIQYFSCFY